MNMYICSILRVYMYMYMHVFVCIYMYVYAFVCVCVCVCVREISYNVYTLNKTNKKSPSIPAFQQLVFWVAGVEFVHHQPVVPIVLGYSETLNPVEEQVKTAQNGFGLVRKCMCTRKNDSVYIHLYIYMYIYVYIEYIYIYIYIYKCIRLYVYTRFWSSQNGTQWLRAGTHMYVYTHRDYVHISMYLCIHIYIYIYTCIYIYTYIYVYVPLYIYIRF